MNRNISSYLFIFRRVNSILLLKLVDRIANMKNEMLLSVKFLDAYSYYKYLIFLLSLSNYGLNIKKTFGEQG